MVVETPLELDELLITETFLADPYPVYHRLRAEAPVFWSERWGCWVLTRYADVHAGLLAHHPFSNVGRHGARLARLPAEQRERLGALASHYAAGGLSNQDPPTHTRLRGLVNRTFTPRVVANLTPRIQQIVDDLLDRLDVSIPIDFVGEFAAPLPAIVIAELLGLPEEDRRRFQTWSDEITAFLGKGRADPASAERGQHNLLELRTYLAQMIEARRTAPGNDLLSAFLAAEERGDVLSEGEVLGSCVTILLGGHETTTNLLGNGLLALLRSPDQLERLRLQPELIPAAVEELLRFDAPVQRVWRLAAEDVELDGRRLHRGDAVFLMVGAANRDPAQFPEPDRLDVGRRPNRHLTFGHGVHFCLGAPLARLEAAIALQTILRRFARIELATTDITFHPNVAFRGLMSLPVVVAPTGRGGAPM